MNNNHTLELRHIRTEDGRTLDAAHYRSGLSHDKSVAIVHVHGKGGNFYSGPGRFLPANMEDDGIDHLSINMRFHDLGYTRNDYEGGETTAFGTDGGMWECIVDGKKDIRASVALLKAEGYSHIFLSGHSAGGFYVGEYGALDDGIAGRILLSPLQDHRFVLDLWFPEDGQLDAALERAHEMVSQGRGHHLIPVEGWFYAISATTLIERAGQQDGVWLRALNASDSPLLMAWGTLESRHDLWTDMFDQIETPNKVKLAIEECDHRFIDYERELAAAVREFVNAHA